MTIQQILKETLNDASIGGQTLKDEDVIHLLKMNICLKASEESYKNWIKAFKPVSE